MSWRQGSLNDAYESQRKLTLFGALTHCRDNNLQMPLELPEMMASRPARIVPPKLYEVSHPRHTCHMFG